MAERVLFCLLEYTVPKMQLPGTQCFAHCDMQNNHQEYLGKCRFGFRWTNLKFETIFLTRSNKVLPTFMLLPRDHTLTNKGLESLF